MYTAAREPQTSNNARDREVKAYGTKSAETFEPISSFVFAALDPPFVCRNLTVRRRIHFPHFADEVQAGLS